MSLFLGPHGFGSGGLRYQQERVAPSSQHSAPADNHGSKRALQPSAKVPWDLKGLRLSSEKYDLGTLKRLCQERHIPIKPKQQAKTLVTLLEEWRRSGPEANPKPAKAAKVRDGPTTSFGINDPQLAAPLAPYQSAGTLNPLEALRMAGGNHAMTLGAMAGHRGASMVPSGGFSRELSMDESFGHGFGHSFGSKIGEQKAEINMLRDQVQRSNVASTQQYHTDIAHA